MKKILAVVLCVCSATLLFAQQEPEKNKKPKKAPIDLSNRPNDHFLLQFGFANWAGIPDTINQSGFSKTLNFYFMLDFPFKNNPKLSMAFGPGIATDHIIFKKTGIGIKENAEAIAFTNLADTNHFKKSKLATAYLEAPIEFRYSAKPETGKGLKMAIGIKVGTLIDAHTRSTKLQNKDGQLINDYITKEASKKFFNKVRLSGMARVGMGHFSLFGSYQFTTLFKDGQGPEVRPFSIGITLSGL
jgi:hypothetical protein